MTAKLARPALGLAALLLCGDAAAAAAEGGLVLVPRLDLLLVLLVLFVALVVPVNSLVFAPIFRILDAREQRIDGTRARAERLVSDGREVLVRYENTLRETREEAEAQRKRELGQARESAGRESAGARGEAERQLEQARARIADELAQARDSLRPRAEELAREAAARVLGRGLQ